MIFKIVLYFELVPEDKHLKMPDFDLVRDRVLSQIKEVIPDRVRITGNWLNEDRVFAYLREPEEALERLRNQVKSK